MDANKPIAGLSVLVAGALVIAGAMVSGAGVWYLQGRATKAAESRWAETERRAAEFERRTLELEAELASATTALRRAAADRATEKPADDTPEDGAPAKTEKNIGYVKKVVWAGDDLSLVVDYAELLTGEAAASAHEADGLGPLDGEQYYIRNRNTKLRTLPVAKDAKTVVWSWFSETEEIAAKEIPLGRFADAMPGGAAPEQRLHSMPYWFTVSAGAVVRIEEQFIP